MYLGLTGYLRQYISYYAHVTKLLQERKTLLDKSVDTRVNACKQVMARTNVMTPTNRELNAFHHFK